VSDTSLMIAENWAESAMMAIPQTSATTTNRIGWRNVSAARRQQAALADIATIVTLARCATRAASALSCMRSLARPAQTQPTAPMAIAAAAALSNRTLGHPAAEAKITAIHPHMLYSSHMWPR